MAEDVKNAMGRMSRALRKPDLFGFLTFAVRIEDTSRASLWQVLPKSEHMHSRHLSLTRVV